MDQDTQERIAYLERELADMSGEVTRLATDVALLTRRVALLMEREATREMSDGGTVPLADQKPPHW